MSRTEDTMAKRENGGTASDRTAKRHKVVERGPASFLVVDTNEVDEHEDWVVVYRARTKRVATSVARDREEAAAELVG